MELQAGKWGPLGWDISLKAKILSSRLGFGLKAGIQGLNVGVGGGIKKKEKILHM